VKQLLALREDHKLQVLGNKDLRKTFGFKKKENQVLLRHLHNPTAYLRDWHSKLVSALTGMQEGNQAERLQRFVFVFMDWESQGSYIKR
jgi:hypothetical protein